MNWRNIDLNLLVVFDAVLRDRSASRAAYSLNMSQPAVSHALARLRIALQDELFIRTPDGMDPTPFALALGAPVRESLDGLRVALEGSGEFQPEAAERCFTLAVNNHAALVLAAPLAAAVRERAPRVTLDLRPSGTLDLAEKLDQGEFDLAIGALAAPAERFQDELLFHDQFAAVLRQDHPALSHGSALSCEALASLPHLVLSSTGEETGFVDVALAQRGLRRHTALRAPLLAAAAALARTDMVAVMSARSASAFATLTPLQVVVLPFTSPSIVTAMLWHRRLGDLAAHRWLRALIRELSRAIRV